MEDILAKQQELMDNVPHDIRIDAALKMGAGLHILDVLFRYLNSTGHKPWRPNPLPMAEQEELINELQNKVSLLTLIHRKPEKFDYTEDQVPELDRRRLISGCGIIEETVEYLNNVIGQTAPKDHQLEELTDILFFYLEQVILSGFTYEQVVEQYHKKWEINMERYRKARENDYSWDDRRKDRL